MRRIDNEERRARIGIRHHLAPSARLTNVVKLADDLVGLHASDPATIYLATAARMKTPARTVPAMERALYVDHTAVKTLCMRRTMFVVPLDLVPVVQAGCTNALVPAQRKMLVDMVESSGFARDGERWLKRVEKKTLAAIEELGEPTAVELGKVVPELTRQMPFGGDKEWAGNIGVSTRLLFLLSAEQRVVRARPKGSWTSSQHRWASMTTWFPDGIPAMHAADARAELVRRWLTTFAPATTTDVKWWTGWPLGQTKAALAAVGAVEVELETGPGWVLPDDEARVRAPKPWVALLPSLDPTMMGWKERDWYLGEHGPALFDRNGNAGPTVWVDGRVVGGWAQRRSGDVVYELLEDVGRASTNAVTRAAEDLQTWLGEVRVKPRFPSPLQKQLEA